MKWNATACLIAILGVLPGALSAQTKVEISVNADYQKMAEGKPIAPDFAGLSFEITSVMPGTGGLAPGVHLFDPQANPQTLALFQQMGIKSLRVGAATGDGCRTPFPTHADLDALFHFAQQANLKIIYQFRMRNPVSCDIPNLEEQSAETARYLWSRYAQNIAALSIGNEVDYHTAHSYCTDGRACACVAGKGCSCLAADPLCMKPQPGKMAPAALIIHDPQMYELGTSQGMSNAGSAFSSYLEEWRKYMGVITAAPKLKHVPVAGPDAFSYTMEARFSGNVCGSSFTSAAWPQLLAFCEKNDPKINFRACYGHYYVGGNIAYGQYQFTAKQAIADMLSPAWLEGAAIAPEPVQPSGIPHDRRLVYTPYSWLYRNDYEPIRKLGIEYRLTESNDFLGGVPNGSNSFASALWALDYMHWWAQHGASGVNFHNNQWIYTDTLVPQNNVWGQPGACVGRCSDYYVTPKGYAIKAFNLGGHGYSRETFVRAIDAPKDWSLTAYAVAAGQDLYVTVINKMQGLEADHEARVTINLTGAPFAKASVASMTLSSGVAGDATRLTAQLAGAAIANTGAQWRGAWTPENADVSGHVSLMVEPATAVIVRFHAGSHYVGPIGINEDGALEIFARDRNGRLWHAWQKAESDLASEPNSAAGHWSDWSDDFSSGLPPVSGLAIAHNQDNTLQAFAATKLGVYTARQTTPGGSWSRWAALGTNRLMLHAIQTAQNADGSLAVFGIDPAGDMWAATERAPGVSWSDWKMLPKLRAGVKSGFSVVEELNGRIDLFALDASAHPALWRIRQTLSNGWDERWFRLGAPRGKILQPGLQVGRTLSGNLTVFALDRSGRDQGGDIWSIAEDSHGGAWGSWSALPVMRGVSLRSGFGALQNSDGRFELIAAGSDGVIYRIAEEAGGGWGKTWEPFSGAGQPNLTQSVFVTGNTNDGRLQVFAADEKGMIYSSWQQAAGGDWENRWTPVGNRTALAFDR